MTLMMEHGQARQPASAERRGEQRRRVLKGAVLSFNNGYSSFECVLRNVSEHGGKLSLGETFGLPTTFRLAIAGEEQARIAQVRWRRQTEIGVSFD